MSELRAHILVVPVHEMHWHSIMPTIKRFHRCRIEMYFGDHNPPHFHVITNSNERVTVAIEMLTVMPGRRMRGKSPRPSNGRARIRMC